MCVSVHACDLTPSCCFTVSLYFKDDICTDVCVYVFF